MARRKINPTAELGAFLKELRVSQRESQQKLADILHEVSDKYLQRKPADEPKDCSYKQIHKYEIGKVCPPWYMALAYAEHYNVSIRQLMNKNAELGEQIRHLDLYKLSSCPQEIRNDINVERGLYDETSQTLAEAVQHTNEFHGRVQALCSMLGCETHVNVENDIASMILEFPRIKCKIRGAETLVEISEDEYAEVTEKLRVYVERHLLPELHKRHLQKIEKQTVERFNKRERMLEEYHAQLDQLSRTEEKEDNT